MYKTVRQSVTFAAPPGIIYKMLMDSKQHAAMTGAPVTLVPKVGGALNAFGGAITGINVELVVNKRIVQQWRANDWPAGHSSTATFELAGTPDGGTCLNLTQTAVPDKAAADIRKGWINHYWKPMKLMIAKKGAKNV